MKKLLVLLLVPDCVWSAAHWITVCAQVPCLTAMKNQNQKQPVNTQLPPVQQVGGFQGFYPILAPPGVVGTYPQLGQLLRYQRGDHQAGHQSFQHPHPFIQASNGGHQPLTRGQPPRRMVEIGELDDTLEEPSVDHAELMEDNGEKPIMDSGASHHLTGVCFLLHSLFS